MSCKKDIWLSTKHVPVKPVNLTQVHSLPQLYSLVLATHYKALTGAHWPFPSCIYSPFSQHGYSHYCRLLLQQCLLRFLHSPYPASLPSFTNSPGHILFCLILSLSVLNSPSYLDKKKKNFPLTMPWKSLCQFIHTHSQSLICFMMQNDPA